MPGVSSGVFSFDPRTENSTKVPSRVPFDLPLKHSFSLSLSQTHIHTMLMCAEKMLTCGSRFTIQCNSFSLTLIMAVEMNVSITEQMQAAEDE